MASRLIETGALGYCVFELQTQQLLAADSSASRLLGVDQRCLENYSLLQLFPGLAAEAWEAELEDTSTSPHANFSCDVGASSSKQTAKLLLSKLLSPKHSWLLVTIQPQDFENPNAPQRDALTGLPDRRQLALHHGKLLNSTHRMPPALALLFLDLDNFKSINDQHGHATGDQVLISLASRWQKCLREHDMVARYGGDEFVAILTGISSRQDAQPIVSRLLAATAEPIVVRDSSFVVSATIGIALSVDTTNSIDDLIAVADREMYAAKAEKKKTT